MQKQINTTCTMDCPDTCALSITVEDDKVIKVAAAENGHPNTAGFICNKVSRFAERLYHKDRILYPQKRIGKKGSDQFARISWDEAIATITERFKNIQENWGGEAIFPYHYGGSNGMLGDSLLDHYYFAKLGTSQCQKTLCAVPTSVIAAEMYGKMPGVAFEDYPDAKFILLWGVNPKVSGIHLIPYLKAAKKNGAFIAVIDPVKNFSDNEVDLHIPVYPGADLPLALGLINYWQQKGLIDHTFLSSHAVDAESLLNAAKNYSLEKAAEIAKVDLGQLQLLADKYAESTPAILRCGWGVERNQNGGQAVAAILAMPALLAKFGKKSGGYTMSNSGAAKLDPQKILGEFSWENRALNQTQLGDFLNDSTLNPPIKSLFVYNCNPLATVPDQNAVLEGLKREDLFTVVVEQVKTDTALYADIILPAVTFLEQQEIRKSYGTYVIGGVIPAISPVGEAKPNEKIFAMLGRAYGWTDAPFLWDSDTYFSKVAEAVQLPMGKLDEAHLRAGNSAAYLSGAKSPIQFETIFPNTPDRKINLTPKSLGDQPYKYISPDEKYPLSLISPANKYLISSTFGEFNLPEQFLQLHPQDAEKRGIQNGDTVRCYNQLGEVVCAVKITKKIRMGVVSLPKGAWRKSSKNKQTATALCPGTINIVGGGACYNDARVEIEKT